MKEIFKDLAFHFIISMLVFCSLVFSYSIGKYRTVAYINSLIEQEQKVSTDNIALEDLKLEINKLR